MSSVSLSPSLPVHKTLPSHRSHSAGNALKETLPSSEVANEAPKMIQGSLGQGIKRALKKTLLRPRGWAELALAFAPFHIGLIFIGKSFLEGVVGADSLFIKRRLGFKALGVSKEFDGRTIKQALIG
ncbi:MAG: hypothetical protein K2X66_05675 [Cyanobacteria bacterium]|nr:hypothetical protein [Cyanobacteriota bacterium]